MLLFLLPSTDWRAVVSADEIGMPQSFVPTASAHPIWSARYSGASDSETKSTQAVQWRSAGIASQRQAPLMAMSPNNNLIWQARRPSTFRTANERLGGPIRNRTIATTSGTIGEPDSPLIPRLLNPAEGAPDDPFENPFGDHVHPHHAVDSEVVPIPVQQASQPIDEYAASREYQLVAPTVPRDECEERFRDYRGPDRDCQIAHCRLQSSPIEAISLNIDPRRELGFDPARDLLPFECTLGHELFAGRHWVPMTFTWKASALCHKPLYFEEVQLERYGHTAGPLLQPVLSGAHFFVNIAVLPYQMGMSVPTECQYALGYYRPGSCSPWLIDPIPISLRGALLQAGAVLGGVYLLP